MRYAYKLQKLKRRISASVGEINADLVFKNGKVLNVFTNETEAADVAVLDGYIVGIGDYKGEKEIDLRGAVVPHGTTAVVIDPLVR